MRHWLARSNTKNSCCEGCIYKITGVNIYKPLQPGIPAQYRQHVSYKEYYPRAESSAYCFWSLQTRQPLPEDFHYLVLPDACIDGVFDLNQNPSFDGLLVMTPDGTSSMLNLGREFYYVGIRFLPGTWHGRIHDIVGQTLQLDHLKGHDFRVIRQELQIARLHKRLLILEQLVASLERQGIVGEPQFIQDLLQFKSVESYAQASGVSRRHLQRLSQRYMGYAPHDFIKIVRFQQSLRQGSFEAYADQAHYIREFKRITGLKPSEFQALYCRPMSDLSNT